jgi:heat shock protein HtpX
VTSSRDTSVVRFGTLEFQAPRGRALAGGRLWFNCVYFLVLGVWSVVGSWHQHRVWGLVAGLVFLELALAVLRVATFVGAVVYTEELAQRIAPPLEELCARGGCPLPRVVIRDDAVRAASVRRSQERVLLVLSAPFVDLVDDRQLRAILAHEVVHIIRPDLNWARARRWAAVMFAVAGGIAVADLGGEHLAVPVYLAGAFVAMIVANVGLSTSNRRLERRADVEGAALCDDPAGLASALGVAQAFSDEARRRVFGPRPWRWILSPLSWRMPTHPSMPKRILRLRELAHRS